MKHRCGMSLDFSSDALAGFREDPDVSVARASQDYLSKLGIGTDGFPPGGKRQAGVRKRRAKLLKTVDPTEPIHGSLYRVFAANDPDTDSPAREPTAKEALRVSLFLERNVRHQLTAHGIEPALITAAQFNEARAGMEQTILNATVVGRGAAMSTPLPDSTRVHEPRFDGSSTPRGLVFDESPIAASGTPAPETQAPTTTPAGDIVAEQLQRSMASSSDLTAKAAAAVQSSAEATTRLQASVEETTVALRALAAAKSRSAGASPALSHQILAQLQGDPSLARLARDGLLRWEDIVHENPAEGAAGHVAGVEVGAPVLIPAKLQTVYDNLALVQQRDSAKLTGAVEVNNEARTTPGFRPGGEGFYPGRQVWMPIRAPPPSLPGRC